MGIIIKKNISLKKFSTFGIGGNADFFIEITSQNDLLEAIKFADFNNYPIFLLGGGSNLLFSDKGLRAVVLHFTNNKIISLGDGVFTAESGTKMGDIFGFTKKENRDFALFSTIPGTIGGATAGNAGIPNLEIKDLFVSAIVYDREIKQFITKNSNFFEFNYRKTSFHSQEIAERYIIWEICFQLPPLKESEIEIILKNFFETRKSKQPWGKTGGSFFSNPKEGAAGYFLDQVGMKGESIGDAFFSEKHANFLMNKKNATQEDVKTLAKIAIQKVFKKFSIRLTPEVTILNQLGEREEIKV